VQQHRRAAAHIELQASSEMHCSLASKTLPTAAKEGKPCLQKLETVSDEEGLSLVSNIRHSHNQCMTVKRCPLLLDAVSHHPCGCLISNPSQYSSGAVVPVLTDVRLGAPPA
jgi:hypothetical protein